MLQNIFGCIFILGFSALFFWFGKTDKKKKDYSQYAVADAYVIQTMDNKWVVEITENNGEKSLGMDDQPCVSTFSDNVPKGELPTT